MSAKQLRMRRLFPKGRCVILPMDHPSFFGPMAGVEDPVGLVRDAAESPADGLLLTLATLRRVAGVIGHLGVVARLDGTATRLGSHLTRFQRFSSVEAALAAGADACVLNVYVGVENEDDLLRKLGETAEQCERWGMPLFAEMIPAAALAGHFGPSAKPPSEAELTEQVALAARVGAEHGADAIKTVYTGSAESFRQVTAAATVPVVIAGGPCADTPSGLLEMTEAGLEAGAMGVIYGRNVWQRPNRKEILRALCAVVHEGTSAEEAAKRFAL